MQVTFIQSPNYTSGREGHTVTTVVLHWIDGRQTAADAQFKNSKTQVSAHFSVDDQSVHQYVKLSDTAWHAGNFEVNLASIGIEFAGSPTYSITDASYETGAQLLAELCTSQHIVPSTITITPHRQWRATECPGTLDIARLIGRVRGILGMDSGGDTEIPVTTPNGVVTSAPIPRPSFFVHTTVPKLNIRSAPFLTAPIIKTTGPTLVECYDTAIGDAVNGDTTWLKRREEDGWMWSGATDYNANNLHLT